MAEEQEQTLKAENEKLKAENTQLKAQLDEANKREKILKDEVESLLKICQHVQVQQEQVRRVLDDLEASKAEPTKVAPQTDQAACPSDGFVAPRRADIRLATDDADSEQMAESMADPEQYFGGTQYYNGEPFLAGQDDHFKYEKEGAFILKCKSNGINMWSLAIDVRTSDHPTEMLPRRGLQKDDKVLFHYTSKQGFEAITSAKGNEIRAGKLMEKSIFGFGVYTSSKAPHDWRSQQELLLNNYLPAKKTWEKREKLRTVQWPPEIQLHMVKEAMTDAQLQELLQLDWTQEFLENLGGQRAGMSEYCVPIICSHDGIKDVMNTYTDAPMMPNGKYRPAGQNMYGEKQPKWRSVWLAHLYERKDLGPGYVQLNVHNATQPPDLVIQVLDKRIAKCPDRSEKQVLEKYYSDAKKEMNKGWFGYISSGETSLLDLDQAFKALEKLKEPLRHSLEQFTVPDIVVLGNTSVGKSALLRRFSQLPFFPSAEGMCTRIPIRVEIRKPTPGVAPSARMSVHRYEKNRYLEEPEPGQSCEIGLEEAIKTVNEKMQELLRKTRLQEEQHMIMDRELRIRVTSENFPMLNIVDLPGLVPSRGEQDRRARDAHDTMELFRRYIGGGHSLYLCVVPATDTPDRWDPMHLIEQEEPQIQINSLGIVTKCDFLRTDQQKQDLRKWLTDEVKDKNWVRLGYGFVAVAAGNKSETQKVQVVDEMEQATFHELLPDLRSQTCINSVRKKITAAYLEQVYERWVPSAMTQLLATWSSSVKKLEAEENCEGLKEHMQSCEEAFIELEQMYKTFRELPSDYVLTFSDFKVDILQPETCQTIHGVPNGPSGRCKDFISNWWKVAGPLKGCELENLEGLLEKFDNPMVPATDDIKRARKVNGAFNVAKTVKAMEGAIADLDESWKLRKGLRKALKEEGRGLLQSALARKVQNEVTAALDKARSLGVPEDDQILQMALAWLKPQEAKAARRAAAQAAAKAKAKAEAEAEAARREAEADAEEARKCNDDIFRAAFHSNLPAARGILRQRAAAVHETTRYGQTPLHFAASPGHTAVALLLLEHRASLEAKDDRGETALDVARRCGRTEVAQILQAADAAAAANWKVEPGYPAICQAAQNGDLGAVRRLLLADPGAVHHANSHGYTVLHSAVSNGHVEMVKVLLTANASLEAQNKHGSTPLHHAVLKVEVKVVKLLLATRASPHAKDKNGETVLHSATRNAELVKVLLTANAPLDVQNSDGFTPLRKAAFYDYIGSAKLLLAARASPNEKNRDGKTPLEWATEKGHTEMVNILKAALPDEKKAADAAAAANWKAEPGYPAICQAAQNGDLCAVRGLLLADPGAVHHANSHGYTVLHSAVSNGHVEIVEVLLTANASPEAQNKLGDAPLHYAVIQGQSIQVAKLLLAARASPHVQDNDGKTPLDWARGDTEMIRILKAAS